MVGSRPVNIRKDTLMVLKEKKRITGRSMPELIEFAVFHMPNISPKRKK